jgi:hypothetical protein
MATTASPPIHFAPPSDAEATALAVVAGSLTRAGTQSSSHLLATRSNPNECTLLAGLRDQMLAGAAVCDGQLDLTLERPARR